MCRWLSYIGEPIFMEELISKPDNALVRQSLRARQAVTTTNGDGFGIAWYDQRAEPGLFRDVLPAWNDANLLTIAHHVRSRLFLAHVRASTGTATSRANCHPFAHGRWSFMHNGQIGGYAKVRRDLEARLGDHWFALREGSTDSELIFLLMLENGLTEEPAKAVNSTIDTVLESMLRFAVDEPLRFTACISNGEDLLAWRYASDDAPPSLFYRQTPAGLVIASEPLDDEDPQWIAVEADQLVRAGGDLAVRPIADVEASLH